MIGPQPTPAPTPVAPTPAYVTKAFLSNILPQLRHLRRAISFPRMKTAPYLLIFLHTKMPNANFAPFFFYRTLTFQGNLRTAKSNSYSRLYFYEVSLRRPYIKGICIRIFFHDARAIPRKNSRLSSRPVGASTYLKRGKEGVCGDVSTLLWKWIAASSSEKGKKNITYRQKLCLMDQNENDWRCLPQTELLVLISLSPI